MDSKVVKSVGRVLRVLELFEKHQTPLSATQICNSLDLPKSSANALLKSLVQLGYLSIDGPTKNYFRHSRSQSWGTGCLVRCSVAGRS